MPINTNKPLFNDDLEFIKVDFSLAGKDEEHDTLKKRVYVNCAFIYKLDDGTVLSDSKTMALSHDGGHPALTEAKQDILQGYLKEIAEWCIEQSKYKG